MGLRGNWSGKESAPGPCGHVHEDMCFAVLLLSIVFIGTLLVARSCKPCSEPDCLIKPVSTATPVKIEQTTTPDSIPHASQLFIPK